MKPTGTPGGGASIGVRAGGSSTAVRGDGGIEGGRGSISPSFSSRSFAEFRSPAKASIRSSEARPLITIRETGRGKVASIVKEGKTPLINIHRDTSSKAPFMVGERFSAIRPTTGSTPQRTEFSVKEVAGLSAIRDRIQAVRQGQEGRKAIPEGKSQKGERQSPVTPETKRFVVTPGSRETRGMGVSYATLNRAPSPIRVEIPASRKNEAVKPALDTKITPATPRTEGQQDRKIIPFPKEQVASSQEGRGQTQRVYPEVPVRIIPFPAPSERTAPQTKGATNREVAPVKQRIPFTPEKRIPPRTEREEQRKEKGEPAGVRPRIVAFERQVSNRSETQVIPGVTHTPERTQTNSKINEVRIENKKVIEKLTKPQAQLIVQEYTQKPKAERKVTPQIVKAILTANEIASPVARAVLVALSQEKHQVQEKPQTHDGVAEQMMQKVKAVIDTNPALKESIQAHLKVALDVYVNYIAIGYASATAVAIVMESFMQRVQQEVKRNKKPTAQLEPGFPPPTDPENEEDDKPEKPEEEEEVKEKEKEEDFKELEFIRAEKVNANREGDIDTVVDKTAYTVEDTGYMVVNGEQVAAQMKQKVKTTSPILVSEGTPEDTPTVDGSFEEIRNDIRQEVKDSTDIQRARAQIKEIIRRHTAVAVGNPRNATEEDVEKVLTVPLEMTAFRMNKGRTNFYQQAA